MHQPEHFVEREFSSVQALIRSAPLATLVTQVEGDVFIDHVPLLIRDCKLHGHLARANPLVDSLGTARTCTAVFSGADAYVSPAWYQTKHDHGRVVPTWNYVTAHLAGAVRAIDDPDWLLDHVTDLSAQEEAKVGSSWRPSDAPDDFIKRMLEHIIGIEVVVENWAAKYKLSQNRSQADQARVQNALRQVVPRPQVADLMQARSSG